MTYVTEKKTLSPNTKAVHNEEASLNS